MAQGMTPGTAPGGDRNNLGGDVDANAIGNGDCNGMNMVARMGRGGIDSWGMGTESIRIDYGNLRDRAGPGAQVLMDSSLPTHCSAQNALRIP